MRYNHLVGIGCASLVSRNCLNLSKETEHFHLVLKIVDTSLKAHSLRGISELFVESLSL